MKNRDTRFADSCATEHNFSENNLKIYVENTVKLIEYTIKEKFVVDRKCFWKRHENYLKMMGFENVYF